MILIKNAKVITCEEDDFENGYILIKDGKIADVGDMGEISGDMECGTVFDAGGKFVCPGFVDAHSHLGMWEDSIAFEGADGNEDTDPITPQLRAIDAINPFDRSFSEAVEAGVTTAVIGPGSANPIGGVFCAVKTRGRRIDDMIIKKEAAMKFAFGENPKCSYGLKGRSPITRMGTAALIREALLQAREYLEDIEKFESGGDVDKPEFNFKLSSLLPVIKGDMPVKAHAHRADDIFTAIRIAKEFSLKMTIEHCTDGHLIADALKAEGISVCAGPSLSDRSKVELSNLTFKAPAILHKSGIMLAIITDHPVIPQRYLPLCAAMAAREGLGRREALRAITINAAKICEIDHRVGSIKKGKDADIVVLTSHPLDFEAAISAVFIDGEMVYNG